MRVSKALRSRLCSCIVSVSVPFAVAAAASALPRTAWAQDADIAQARQLGQQAQAAYDAGNYAESEKLWAAAAKLYSAAPTLTLGLARTQAKLGKVVAAQESYNRIIREWSSASAPPPAFKDALEAAKAEVGGVSAKVASVVVTVEGPASPQVTLDGQAVNAAALGLRRPVDPGTHTVKASAEGFKPAETTFQVAEGGSAEAKLKMEKAGAAGVAVVAPADGATTTAPPTEPGADTGGSGRSSRKTLALVAFGVGGAGLIVGGITGLLAMGKAGDLEESCPNKLCPASEQDNVDSYKSMGTISTIGFVVAGVGGITGAVLWFTAPKETASAGGSRYATVPARGLTMTPYLGVASAGVTGRF